MVDGEEATCSSPLVKPTKGRVAHLALVNLQGHKYVVWEQKAVGIHNNWVGRVGLGGLSETYLTV